jgi:hypothetical protein
MVTFKVDKVKKGQITPANFEYMKADPRTIRGLVGLGVEASSTREGVMTSPTHNLLAAVNVAYDRHLPLMLSPDMLWLMISQGLSTHITNNAEQLRHQFVNFEGKKELIVYEDNFVKGSPDNDWSHMFGQFSNQLSEYIGKKRDLIVNRFSTTGPIELAASEIVLMEAMSKYFDYTCCTCCGIPEITLLGSVSDWQDILVRVRNIAEFDLAWWTAKIEPIAQEFVAAAQGQANVSFWRNIFKSDGGSGGPYISGWITDLFPYLRDYKTETFTVRNTFNQTRHEYTTNMFPMGLAKVPFKWEYYQLEYKMELAAGFSGYVMEEDCIKPHVGWFVRDTELMVEINLEYKDELRDWDERQKLRNQYLTQLATLGFEENGGYGNKISGALPKNKLAEAQQIKGLIFTK